LVLGAVALLAGAAVMFGMSENRLRVLSTDIRSHIAVPSVKRLSLNGREVVSASTRGRSETGAPDYPGRDGTLTFDLAWYDILEKRAYALTFSVPSSDVSTFGEDGDHGSIAILTGPGADVTVTTPNPDALRLVGLKQLDRITPEMEADITLQQLCATPLDPDDAVAAQLADTVEDWSLEQAMQNRERWLAENPAPTARCADGG
jgi:hypothetical protein